MNRDHVAAIAGVAESDLGVVAPKTALQLQAEAAREALSEAGLTLADVDGVFSAGGDEYAPTLRVAEYLGIQPRHTDSTNIGGSSFVSHAGHARAAIAQGLCEVALITYGSTQRSSRSRALGRTGGVRGPFQFEGVWGLPLPVGAYALAATRHMSEYGTTSEQLAEVAVATRAWAALNPKAFYRDPITVDDVLGSPWISEPLHLLDCCLVTDGGGAVVVVSAERARDLPKTPIWIAGHGESHSHMTIANMPNLTTTPADHSGPAAMGMAGVTHADIDVVELYDSFTITVLLTLEALGFCGRGESGAFVSDQRTAPGGDFPMNTNGGGLSYTHPGMYGIFTLIEATRQLRGECDERQVEGAEIALCNGTGGVLSSTATVVLAR
ncbi:MAG TPA: acetyl-CoA acetyltransferase [Candidatus Dormibacteraeota bacterium]